MQHIEQNFLIGFLGGIAVCFFLFIIFIKNKRVVQKIFLYFPFFAMLCGLFANIPRIMSFGKLDYIFFFYPLVNARDLFGKTLSFIILMFAINAVILFYIMLTRERHAAA
ncbi:hypothetical protein KY316_00560 [Candidatus Woesearchaeota archaeon]|nr:hypothetical protein [Candidatus Woesearchaeota archaeon]